VRCFCRKSAVQRLQKSPDGFENLLLWHAQDAKYICIEPWMNLPDTEGKENIEFSQKEGVMKVAPNTVKTLTRTITLF